MDHFSSWSVKENNSGIKVKALNIGEWLTNLYDFQKG